MSRTVADLPAGASPQTAPRDLDRSLLQGIAWTGGVKWIVQALTWASTLVVARLLSPADYGLVGMAALYLGLITMLSEFGLGAAIVALRDLTRSQVEQLNTVAVMFGVASFAASCAAAPLLGRFFDAPRLPMVVVVMSVAFVVTALKVVPQATLQREMRFRSLALVEGAEAGVATLTTLSLAWAGFGYWSLVAGGLAGATTSTLLLIARSAHGFARPDPAALAGAVRFSGHIIVGRLAWFVQSNSDFMIVGRMLGQSALGTYSFGWTLAGLPVEKVTAMLGRVMPALFSSVQSDLAALRRYLLAVTEAISIVTFPTSIGIALTADDFVRLVLGEQWEAAIGPLRVLAFCAALRSIAPLLPQVLNIVGESRFGMRNGVAAAVLFPAGFLIGSRWGPVGIAAAWLVVHPLTFAPVYWRVFTRIEMPLRSYLAVLWPAVSGSLVMAASVLAARSALDPGTPLGLRLGATVTVGALAYSAVLLLLHRPRLLRLRDVIQTARARA